jgi:ribosomal protein S18
MISSQGTTTQTAMWSRWSTCPLQNLLACLLTTVYSVRMARTAYELTCVVESFCGSSCGGVVMGISLQNAALLSHFVSESGRILPKRQTKCCAKHQRPCVCYAAFPCVCFVPWTCVLCHRLARVIRRARALNLLPFMSKPHPLLRFTSLKPAPVPQL